MKKLFVYLIIFFALVLLSGCATLPLSPNLIVITEIKTIEDPRYTDYKPVERKNSEYSVNEPVWFWIEIDKAKIVNDSDGNYIRIKSEVSLHDKNGNQYYSKEVFNEKVYITSEALLSKSGYPIFWYVLYPFHPELRLKAGEYFLTISIIDTETGKFYKRTAAFKLYEPGLSL